MMNKSIYKILTVLVAACLVFVAYNAGKTKSSDELQELVKQQEELKMLNRSSVENMVVEDGIIYVIGHKSPDSDTVCSAIAYARLLNLLGHEAKAVITASVNNETKYILKEAGKYCPDVQHGTFGAYMKIDLLNDGPFTIVLDSDELFK